MPPPKKGLSPSWEIEPLPSHETSPRRMPNVPLFDEVEEPVDESGPFTISPETRDNPHPIDLKEGLLEKLVHYAASLSGNHADDDRIYLEQYMHPERDIIPRQPLRPTKGGMGPSDDMIYRRLPEVKVGEHTYPTTDGLGNFTKSKGKDYDSAYDIWDFDTGTNLIGGEAITNPLQGATNWISKKVMQNVGTPFKVYERYNKDKTPWEWDDESISTYKTPMKGKYYDMEQMAIDAGLKPKKEKK